MSKISLEKFIEKTKGTAVDVPWEHKGTKLKGECVSLIQCYIQDCLEQPAQARGNAKDWIQSYVNEGLGHTVADQRKGDIIVFPNDGVIKGVTYGHIAIYIDENTIYDQGDLRHNNGLAGFGKIFSYDFVTLRPNAELVEDPKEEPITEGTKYLNIHPKVDTWRVYPMNVAPVVGNECKELLPSKFGGLSYTIKGYTQSNIAIIETRDFGQVQIYIGQEHADKFEITDSPIYGLVN